MQDAPLIEFKNVTKSFEDKLILDGVNFTVQDGETFCVIGGSGTGKSVTLKLLLGLIPFDEGEIYFQGRPISEMDDDELNAMRSNVGMLFQGGALFDSMTVYENVAYPLEETGRFSAEDVGRIVHEKLSLVGLNDVDDLFPSDLSGGMVKRVGLARALATEPHVILYDEPTAGLDPTNVNRIDDMILDLKKRLKVASVVVTHHMPSVFRIADKVALLYRKKIAFIGTIQELRTSRDPIVHQFIEGRIGD